MRRLISILAAAFCIFSLGACSSESKSYDTLIVGDWRVWKVETEGEQIESPSSSEIIFSFQKNGTVTFVEKEDGVVQDKMTGTYTIKNDIVTITINKTSLSVKIKKLDSKEMVLYEEKEDFKMYFKKV